MKQIEVVAAIIRKGDKIFATQRGYGEWKDWWEFPGGKMEDGETPEEALVREIREELSTEISVDEFLCTVEYDYPKFHLKMHCYLCSLVTEALHLNEHEAAKWLTKDELDGVNWLPADVKVIENVRCLMEDVNRIKLVLVEKKRTSKWLAEQLGVNPSTVSKWCTNSSQPDLACILKIADLLEVDLKELFVREYKQYLLSQESK